MTFATSPITSSRPSPVDASPTKTLYWSCHGRGASLVLPIDRGPRRLSAWRIRFTEAADLIRRRRRRSDPFAAAAEIPSPTKVWGEIWGIRPTSDKKSKGIRALVSFVAMKVRFEPAVIHAPWRLGGDSCQTKSRSKERLSDFLLLIQHLTWLRG